QKGRPAFTITFEGPLEKVRGVVANFNIYSADRGFIRQELAGNFSPNAVFELYKKKAEELAKQADVKTTNSAMIAFISSGVKLNPAMVFRVPPKEILLGSTANGGIDLNGKKMGLDIAKDPSAGGISSIVKLDPAMVAQFQRGDFLGVVPIIIKIIPIANPSMILGINSGKEPEITLAKV
ncbi:MAG: hypothetical protein WCH62_01995, partial [Candidatus Omnitrophota bacterium]